MNKNNIGKLLLSLRKEKNLTQKELGEKIGVSDKTISKWESGNGLPDVSLLERISNVLNISVDDLLKGKHNQKYKYNPIIFIIIFIIVLSIIILIIINNKNKENNDNISYNCKYIANYYIKLINDSNDENYKYITINMFQSEGVYTVKVPLTIAADLKENARYKFTFNTIENLNYNDPTEVFNHSEIINITKSTDDELGSKYECQK